MSRERAVYLAAVVLLSLVLGGIVYAMLALDRPSEGQVTDVSPGLTHVRSIYGTGTEADELFVAPYGVAFHGGELFVSDSDRGVVHVFGEDGVYRRSVGEKGGASGQLVQPLGITADADKRLYVADRGHSKLVVYDADGATVREVPVETPLTPYVADGIVYVTTAAGVALFDQGSFQELASWGTRGRGDDEFDFPNGIARDAEGTVYVADGNNLRVKAVDANGQTTWVVGRPPSGMSDVEGRVFGLTGGMALVDDTLYVTDPLSGMIHLVSTDGRYLAQVGDMGSGEGSFGYPSQIVSMGDRRFAVAEWGNARVQIIEIDRDAAIAEHVGG